ncbi:MAG: pyridoxal phosphate-dependent aminotransferase [Rickettsiales bacterium]
MIAKHIRTIKPSATLSVSQKARELKSMGREIISLSAGEPDFATPQNICDAASLAMGDGKTKYTPVDGIPELKEAIIHKYQNEKNLQYDSAQVIISNGAKQSIYNAFQASLNPGDEVIIIAPYWVSYPDMVMLAKGVPIIVSSLHDKALNLEEITNKISDKTKWIVINSPNNPEGSMLSRQDLEGLSEILRKNKNIHLISDDIYEDLTYEDSSINILQLFPDLKDRVLIINGVSKSYAMTGWRIGYALGNKELIKNMKLIQSQSTSGACSISQYAAVEAIKNSQGFVEESRKIFMKRRNLFCSLLESIPQLKVSIPEGSFYLFIDARECINKTTPEGHVIKNDIDLCEYFLNSGGVAVVPGSAFGKDGFFRASYATSEEQITAGSKKIIKSCESLR